MQDPFEKEAKELTAWLTEPRGVTPIEWVHLWCVALEASAFKETHASVVLAPEKMEGGWASSSTQWSIRCRIAGRPDLSYLLMMVSAGGYPVSILFSDGEYREAKSEHDLLIFLKGLFQYEPLRRQVQAIRSLGMANRVDLSS